MAEQEDRLTCLPAFEHVVINRERVGVIFKALNEFAHTLRLAMANMVKPIDGISKRDEVVDHVHVAPAMFTESGNDKQHGLYVPFGKPSLIIDVGIPHALEIAFDMIHEASFFRLLST